MVNVECPGCSAPYSVSDRRIPDNGLKMRCPKCGESFVVDRPGASARAAPQAGSARSEGLPSGGLPSGGLPSRGLPSAGLPSLGNSRTLPSVGAPLPPASKKPLFGARSRERTDDLPLERPGPPRGGFGGADGFGALDFDLPGPDPRATAPSRGTGKGGAFERDLPLPLEDDLPMALDDDLPMALEDDLPMALDDDRPMALDDDRPMAFDDDLPMALDDDLPRSGPQGWALDDDLPLRAEAQRSREAYDDLPSLSEDDLPMARDDEAPGHLDDDLPLALEADLPSRFDDDLPAHFDDDLPLPSQEADLPLPGPQADLPLPARHGDLPLAFDQDFPLAHARGDLPLALDDDFPIAHGDGDLPLPEGHDLPLPSAHGDLPLPGDFDFPDTIGAGGDGIVRAGDGEGAIPSGDRAFLDDGRFPAEDEDFAADLASQPPRGQAPTEPAGEAPGDGTAGALSPRAKAPGEGEARARTRKKRPSALRGLLVAVPLLAIGGGLLSFTPLGPYGYHAISDALRADDYAQSLTSLRQLAQDELDGDTAPAARSLLQRARSEHEASPRHLPTRSYVAYLAFVTTLRFGSDTETMAIGRQLLDDIPIEERGPLYSLALGAQQAAEGQLDAARASAMAAESGLGPDVDASVLAAEIALRARSKDASEAWKRAVALRRSARTLFGLARAESAAGNGEAAAATARQVIELSKDHAGARLLLAQTRFDQDPKSEPLLAELEELTGPGPISAAASRSELVAAHSLLGDVLLARSKMTAAEKAYAEALKLDPQSVRALVGNGELLYAAGRFSEALARYEAATRVAPGEVQAVVGKAKSKIALERAKEARADLEPLLQASPHPLVGFWLGKAEEATGDAKAAEESYRKAIQSAPAHPDVVYPYVQLADLLSARGAQTEAEGILREATEKLPDNPRLYLAKGEVALKLGRLEDAQRELTRALELDPADSVARFRLAVALRKNRQLEPARAELDRVAAADPEFPGLSLEQGLLFENAGETEKALAMYKAALEKAPADDDLKLRVGSTLVASGAPDQALPILREVLTKRSQSPEVNHFLGRALLGVGEPPQEALRYLQNAAQNDPNRAEYHLFVAWAANESGQASVAEAAIDKALAIDKNLGDAYWQRAIVLQKRGQTLDALRELEVALERNPSRFEAYATMARCHQDQADYVRAEAAWRKAIAGNDRVPEWHFRYGKILFDRGARGEAAPHLRKAVEIVAQRRQTPAWLWNANYLLGEALRNSDKERALLAFKEFMRLTTEENAYRRDAERAIEALERR